MRAERGLVNLILKHAYLVVARAKVQLGKEFGASEFIKELFKHRNRELVLEGLGVQCTVVDA